MCWNTQFSILSAVVGWATCLVLYRRNHSPRDRWYAAYLLTYTFTQIIDIALWTLHQSHAPLTGCEASKMSWSSNSIESAQLPQFLISKYGVPLVTFSQFLVQLHYPSELHKHRRNLLVALHGLPCVGMAFQFACSDVIWSRFPAPHETIRWGGHTAETWQVLLVVGVFLVDFFAMMERSVATAHSLTLLSVVGTLWVTEGTLALGSKWCTYCLIFSAVYLTDPLWGPGGGARPLRAGSRTRAAATNSNARVTRSTTAARHREKVKGG
jgi:hypothetical protein